MTEKIKSFLRKPQMIVAFIFLASGAITIFLVYGIPYFYNQYTEMTKNKPEEQPKEPLLQHHVLQIDPNFRKNEDVSFLEGMWQTEPMAIEEGTNEGVILNYHLDVEGQGMATLTMANQTECQTAVEARFLEDGRLSIRDLKEAECSDQTHFRRLTILCQGEGDQTSCEGQYIEQKPFPITLFQQLYQTSSKPQK